MSRLQSLKTVIHRRLTAAVEEIIGHLERTITEYEEELESRHRQLLETAVKPEERLRGADTEQPFQIKEEQQNWMPGLDQEENLEQPHIKEEKEDLWSGQEIGGQHEENITAFSFSHVPGKSESHEEEPQLSQPHHRGTEEHEEPTVLQILHSSAAQVATVVDGKLDCGGSEKHRSSVSGFKCQPGSDDKMSPSLEDSGDEWREVEPQTVFTLNKVPVHDSGRSAGGKSFSCTKCGKKFGQKHHLQTHMRCHTGEKPFSCSLCGKRFTQKGNLTQHLNVHTREKPCSCPVCGERFAQKGNLTQHMTVHTREKPCSCPVCGERFAQKGNLTVHMNVHMREKSLWAQDGQRDAERPELHLP